MKPIKLAVIGAGASGVAAAIEAANGFSAENIKAEITVLEHLNKPLKKLLVTGNGRCNFTNTKINTSSYHGSRALIERVISSELSSTVDFFGKMGILTYCEDGRVYPRSQQAASIRNTLLYEAESLGINIKCESEIDSFSFNASSREFTVNDKTYDAIIAACGGKAAPKQGSDGSFYEYLTKAGHTFTPLLPALTAITCSNKDLKLLSGTRLKGGLTLFDNKRSVATEHGELQFTENAVSGIPSFNISHLARCGMTLVADMCEDMTENEITGFLKVCKSNSPYKELETALCGILPQKAVFAVINRCKIKERLPLSEVSDKLLSAVSRVIKNMEFSVTGTRDFYEAQVMSGGISTNEINVDTLMSKKLPGLFFCGEILDATGECGGYNLNFAFASGRLAGKNAAQFSLKNRRNYK